MWILTKQLHTSRYVADMKGLGLDSEEFSQISEKSLMWRSKPSLSKTWLRRWKRVSWMQHLSSRILKSSHTESFVERYLLCQQVSPANLSVLQESGRQLKTPDIYFLTSSEESKSVSQTQLSLKMSKESSQPKQQKENPFSSMSSEDWKSWVTQQRQEYSQRVKLARHIRESESSSWATPRAGNPGSRPNGKGGKILAEQAQQSWPTARTSDAEGGRIETEMTEGGFKSKRHKSEQTFGAKLRDAVETHEENWATPIANDAKGSDYAGKKENPKALYLGGQVKKEQSWPTPTIAEVSGGMRLDQIKEGKWNNIQLREKIALLEEKKEKSWPTPTAVNRVRDEETMEKCLKFRQSNGQTSVPLYLEETVLKEQKEEEKNWATPSTMDHLNVVRKPEERSEKANKGGCKNLREEVLNPQNWPTPTARDHAGANSVEHCIEKPRHNTQLPNAVMLNELGNPQNWPTPRARDWKDTPGCSPSKIGDVSLPRKVDGLQDQTNPNINGKNQESWVTPKASTGNHPDYQSERERRTPDLESDVRIKMGYPPLKTASQKGRLNPDWVEQLMGLPVGWTQIESID